MRKLFDTIRKFITPNEKKVLGRWNTEYCAKKIDTKIDWSNEDHCGPCGQYILQTVIKEKDASHSISLPLKK